MNDKGPSSCYFISFVGQWLLSFYVPFFLRIVDEFHVPESFMKTVPKPSFLHSGIGWCIGIVVRF